jgi:hypothetical protein
VSGRSSEVVKTKFTSTSDSTLRWGEVDSLSS